MKTLNQLISRYIYIITGIIMLLILGTVFCIQSRLEQKNAIDDSQKVFMQIEKILNNNNKDLQEIEEGYKQTCLNNAEVVSIIIESDPDILNSIDKLREIADSLEIDEIHIFDDTGRIFTGTHPKYYNYTFDSGEQINFFKPLLTDKSLKLVQDITPNTAEDKLMQYSAQWSNNGKFIVQIGMEPHNVTKVTKKNELSYIFGNFRVNPDINFFAITGNGTIVGSTNTKYNKLNATELGFSLDKIKNKKIFHSSIDGNTYYCIFEKIDETYVGRCIPVGELYSRVPSTMITLFICLIVITILLANAVTRYMKNNVVDKIHMVNEHLNSITKGSHNDTLNIESSAEFHELTNYLNNMIKSILDSNKKMSYVLSKTNLYIGIYEYNNNLINNIRYTEYVPKILSLDEDTMKDISSDNVKFKNFINTIQKNPIPDEKGVYMVSDNPKRYIRLEEINNDGEIFGVVIDITSEIKKRKELEFERDIDSLTGIYNRRGFDDKLSNLLTNPTYFTNSAIVMIDADSLKEINDSFGHEKGDVYLKGMALLLDKFEANNSIACRLGGDEFLLLLYNYENQSDLINSIVKLKNMQDTNNIKLDDKTTVPIKFSYGYSVITNINDYNIHLRDADRKMYINKLIRKENTK